ncbi:hypothetical protein [Clostridium akagii]|uniref:hypothetical protein n=1 Tax=Clostridium akagii TaxID=91623 RepID=UPI00047DB9FC|nr:hypothetical protein [Clostridium akagii]
MINLNRRDKILLIILAVLAVLFLYAKLLIIPSTDKISNINSQISSNEAQIVTLDYKKDQNTIIKRNIKNLQPKYDDAKNQITISRKDGNITTDISRLCSNHNVKLTSLVFQEGVVYSQNVTGKNVANPNKSVPNGNLMEMGTTITITGSISDVIKFIDDLEHTKRIDVINNVSINNSDNTNKASIVANYFYISGEDTGSASDSTSSTK